MSYRELREFTESLRALGYPRLISMDNFRTPNIRLVAEILVWLLKKYDPDNDISSVLDTEQDRVIFVKTAAFFLISKARIKVNPKKLYQADGFAVQELLKVTTILYEAAKKRTNEVDDSDDASDLTSIRSNINSKMNDLRIGRQLASEIPDRCASLFYLLSKEVALKEQRSAALARPLELQDVEKSIRRSIKTVEEQVKQTTDNLNSITSDEATLDTKIDKKKIDLERQQKRLIQLQTVRPAYMDEYERFENRLEQLYAMYVLKFRNLVYLEHIQAEFDRAENERSVEMEISTRKMVEKVREEERKWISESERLEAVEEIVDDEMDDEEIVEKKKKPTIYGNITGAGMSADEDDGDDGDEDSPMSDDGRQDEHANDQFRPKLRESTENETESSLHPTNSIPQTLEIDGNPPVNRENLGSDDDF